MRNQSYSHTTDLIRYRYNIVAEDGRAVIRAVPVKTSRAEIEREPVAAERNDVERVNDADSPPVLRRIRHRLLDR